MNEIESIRIFTAEEVAANGGRPDYIFASDENAAVLWPEQATAPDGTTVTALRAIEHYAGSPETVELRIWGYDMPRDAEEYREIIRTALPSEIESVEEEG